MSLPTPLQEAADRVRVARTFAALHRDEASRRALRAALTEFNLMLKAREPMFFACIECGGEIVVPECYVIKPDYCPSCGGEWSRST